MRIDDVDADLKEKVFEFCYWFSRMEFALKENQFFNHQEINAPALPAWGSFEHEYRGAYEMTADAMRLINESPELQVVGEHGKLTWRPRRFNTQDSDLQRVILSLKTVRNNLFHGGKSDGHGGYADPARTMLLLTLGIRVIHELAAVGQFPASLEGVY